MIYRYTILYVADVAQSLAFYGAAFGFETAFLHEAGDYGALRTGETKLAFSSHALMQQIGKSVAPPRLKSRPTNWRSSPRMSPPPSPAPLPQGPNWSPA